MLHYIGLTGGTCKDCLAGHKNSFWHEKSLLINWAFQVRLKFEKYWNWAQSQWEIIDHASVANRATYLLNKRSELFQNINHHVNKFLPSNYKSVPPDIYIYIFSFYFIIYIIVYLYINTRIVYIYMYVCALSFLKFQWKVFFFWLHS